MTSRNDRRTGGVHAAVRWVRRAWLGGVASCVLVSVFAPSAFAQDVDCGTIRWDPAVGPVVGYDVYVEVDEGDMLYHDSTDLPELLVRGGGLESGDALRFQVVPYAADGRRGEASGVSETIFCERVPTPANVAAQAGSLRQPIELSWSPLDFVEFYVIFRALAPDSPGTFVDRTEDSSWEDLEAEADVDYYYRVAAVSARQVSGFSETVHATSSGTRPHVVASSGTLSYTPAPNEVEATQSVELRNVGDWPVTYEAWSSAAWLSVTPSTATIDEEDQTLELHYDFSGLQPGNYRGVVDLYSYYEPLPGESFVLESPETIEVWVTILDDNSPPVLETSLGLTINEGTTTVVPIHASDPDEGDYVEIAIAFGLPDWAVFEMLESGEAQLTLSPGYDAAGTYQSLIAAWDDNEPAGLAFRYFTIVVANTNQGPVPTPIPDLTVSVGTTEIVPLSAVDPDPGDRTAIVTSSLPAFATHVDFGNGTGQIKVQPEPGDEGSYLFIVAFLDHGSPPRSVYVWFTVTVEP